jgi:hypothetical protein
VLLEDGLPKLDFGDLTATLRPLFIYLPTVAVETNEKDWLWVVSGNKAMLVKNENNTKS